jgi:hypothetical protein
VIEERTRLGIEDLKIRVDEYTERGEGYFDVVLDSLREVDNDKILSEGERKALALACFFAEIGGIEDHSGIILDDPVSSLDHVHRRRVAERIVHDLVFYHELQFAAANALAPVPLRGHHLRHVTGLGCGAVREDDQPWEMKKTGPRIEVLQRQLAELRGMSDRSSSSYRDAITRFYKDLRETWERFVEGDLLNDVVGRFDTDVRTRSLRGVVVDDEDYRLVHVGMKRASVYSGHDGARALQVSLPDSNDAAKELQFLIDFRNRTVKRRKELEPKREALEDPPRATLG